MQHQQNIIRTCLGCMQKRSQSDLVRFVRGKTGSVIEDVRNVKGGRGAYICLTTKEKCLIKAIQRGSFDRSLPR